MSPRRRRSVYKLLEVNIEKEQNVLTMIKYAHIKKHPSTEIKKRSMSEIEIIIIIVVTV